MANEVFTTLENCLRSASGVVADSHSNSEKRRTIMIQEGMLNPNAKVKLAPLLFSGAIDLTRIIPNAAQAVLNHILAHLNNYPSPWGIEVQSAKVSLSVCLSVCL